MSADAWRLALWPLSVVYGAVVRVRARLYMSGWLRQKRLNATVISVGNLTTGGTGKTPMVIWLAEKLLAEGKRVGILSRGYRGTNGTSDEIEIMKRHLGEQVLFGVGKDRYAKGRELERRGADTFLLDDGFQHLQLARDCDIVMIDATKSVRQQFLLPAGPLREPLSAVNRADLVLFSRINQAPGAIPAMQHVPQFPVFPARTKLIGFRRAGNKGDEPLSIAETSGPSFAFCGIGNPDAFFCDLAEWKIPVVGQTTFRDHHRYTAMDASKIEKMAAQRGATALVTTEKDEQNLGSLTFALPIFVAVIALEIPDEQEVLRTIKAKAYPRRGVAA